MPVTEPTTPFDVAPCGCRFGVVGDAFVIEPCDLDCEVYTYAVEEGRRQQKEPTFVDLRDDPRTPVDPALRRPPPNWPFATGGAR